MKGLPVKVRTDSRGRKYAVARDGKRVSVKEGERRNKLARKVRARIRDKKGRFGTRRVKIMVKVRERGAPRVADPMEDYEGTNVHVLDVSTEDKNEWRLFLDAKFPNLVHFDISEVKR